MIDIYLLFFHIASDFGIVFNQTSYTVVVDHTLALTGIPLVPFTVYFSESVTSTVLVLSGTGSWTAALSGIGGDSTEYFHLDLTHFFPDSFTPPLADSDAIVASENNAPGVGNYSYQLSVTVLTRASPFSPVLPVTKSVIVNIMLIEAPGEYIVSKTACFVVQYCNQTIHCRSM